jgi:hypothetical protein
LNAVDLHVCNMEQYINISMQIDIIRCFQIYGIEGTEQKIKEIYHSMPKMKAEYLKVYHQIVFKKG